MYLQYPYSVLREHIQIIYIVLHNLLKIGFTLVVTKLCLAYIKCITVFYKKSNSSFCLSV